MRVSSYGRVHPARCPLSRCWPSGVEVALGHRCRGGVGRRERLVNACSSMVAVALEALGCCAVGSGGRLVGPDRSSCRVVGLNGRLRRVALGGDDVGRGDGLTRIEGVAASNELVTTSSGAAGPLGRLIVQGATHTHYWTLGGAAPPEAPGDSCREGAMRGRVRPACDGRSGLPVRWTLATVGVRDG